MSASDVLVQAKNVRSFANVTRGSGLGPTLVETPGSVRTSQTPAGFVDDRVELVGVARLTVRIPFRLASAGSVIVGSVIVVENLCVVA